MDRAICGGAPAILQTAKATRTTGTKEQSLFGAWVAHIQRDGNILRQETVYEAGLEGGSRDHALNGQYQSFEHG